MTAPSAQPKATARHHESVSHSRDYERVHVAVIGTGQAGPSLAAAFANDGETVAIFEGGSLGGTCVNDGCTPTKTLRKSARVAHMARRAADFGVQVGDVTVNFAAAMARMDGVVNASRSGLGAWLAKTAHLTVVHEWAQFDGRVFVNAEEGASTSTRAPTVGGFVIRAGPRRFVADRVYLNVGTHSATPPVPGLDAAKALLNDTLLKLRELPSHLVILGGSYIGLELGQIFRRFGSNVTIIERSAHVISREDPNVSERLETVLRGEGIRILTNVVATAVEGTSGTLVTVHVKDQDSESTEIVTGSHLLVAAGRRPNTEHLGLETVGVTVDVHGYVPVNGAFETNVPGIWAVGDVNRRGAFTHTSYQDHEIVLANHRGHPRTADARIPTYALFTDPPMGRVGISETTARRQMAQGKRFLIVNFDMKNVSRAKEEGELDGVIQVIVDAETDQLVGATVLGIGGDEIVQVVSVLIEAKAPYQVLQEFLPIHPTVTEFFPTILGKLRPLE